MATKRPRREPGGILYGYPILVLRGEFDDPEKTHRWKVPSGTLETDDLLAVLSARTAFSLDSIVSEVAALTARRESDRAQFEARLEAAGFDPKSTFMRFLMRRLVTEVIASRRLPDSTTEPINLAWLLFSERVLMDVAGLEDRATKTDRWSVHSLGMRVMQAQYHDQLDHTDYKRELWLARRVVRRCAVLGIDLEQAYTDAFGLTYSELAALSFATYANITGNLGASLDPASWDRNKLMRVSDETKNAYFRLCSLTYEEFQEKALLPEVRHLGYESYALSPLVRYPLVRRTDGLLVAPIITDLLERPTRAFKIDALQAVAPLGKQGVSVLNQAEGDEYEGYVWRMLTSCAGVGKPFRGAEILPQDRPNCDFVCVESGSATLIEAKAVRIRLSADMTKKRDELRKEFGKENGLANGLVQINESARAIRNSETHLKKGVILNGLLVVRGEQILLNTPFVRELLDDLVWERSRRKMIVKYQIVNDDGLGALLRMLQNGGSLAEFLYKKRKHKISDTEDMYQTVTKLRPSLPGHALLGEFDDEFDALLREFVEGRLDE